MRKLLIVIITFVLFIGNNAFSQTQKELPKKRLSPEVYTSWKTINTYDYTDSGLWLCYEINPAKGDGFLCVYNTETGKTDSIPRGNQAQFSPDGKYLAFLIKPQYDTLRKMKLNKVKKRKLPKDSLGILFLDNDSLIKIPKVKSFVFADSLSNFLIYKSMKKKEMKMQQPKEKGWWIFKKKNTLKPKPPKMQKGDHLVVYFPLEGKKYKYKDIDDFTINHDGSKIAFTKVDETDSIPQSTVRIFTSKTRTTKTIFEKPGLVDDFTFDESGNQWAFLFSTDTAAKNKVFDFYYGNASENDTSYLIADTSTSIYSKGFCPSKNRKPYFSKDGTKLYFGVAPRPIQEPKDTLLPNEKYSVDVWNYQDGLLQPQQKLMARREIRRTYLTVYHIDTKNIVQLENPQMRRVSTIHNGNSIIALGSSSKPYEREQSWDGWYSDYSIVNTLDGSRDQFLTHFSGRVSLSADGSYAIYFESKDSSWYAYDIEGRRQISLTKELPVNFYNEENDVPNLPRPYGIAGWYKGDKYVVIYDKYDLWKIDPTGRTKAVNLTEGFGRKNNIKFREYRADRKHKYFNDENPHWLYAFDFTTKQSGYYQLENSRSAMLHKIIMSDDRYYNFLKPRNADILFWRKMNFQEDPEIYVSDINFNNIKKITTTNPQQSEYLWGTVELTKWTAFDGQELEGLIYKPADFDSTRRYPMIVYFYEKYSNNLHQHYIPKPSHSTVNFTEYVSNGYIVFVPDITYKVGHPAKSAYNAIVSGTEFMKKNPWIDSDHIGIQGQSWGGYQAAMLVTMTDIYACAEAGAPVSNMTSAYGGIRWGSGMSRAFQYEKTQSRIGYTLWDSLDLYIENSPIFFAPKVKTPLLIMHNDKDGAVPWYQGIEYFNALRRLDKKVWMLSYNNDDHNLMKWPNRVDLSIRMMGFFDHYLKGKPMPPWMSEGIPAVDKGKVTGY